MLNTIKLKIVLWLLSSRKTQVAIRDMLLDEHVVQEFVEDIVSDAIADIEYSDVRGLESYVDREIENNKPDVYADDVIGLDRYVTDRVRS